MSHSTLYFAIGAIMLVMLGIGAKHYNPNYDGFHAPFVKYVPAQAQLAHR